MCKQCMIIQYSLCGYRWSCLIIKCGMHDWKTFLMLPLFSFVLKLLVLKEMLCVLGTSLRVILTRQENSAAKNHQYPIICTHYVVCRLVMKLSVCSWWKMTYGLRRESRWQQTNTVSVIFQWWMWMHCLLFRLCTWRLTSFDAEYISFHSLLKHGLSASVSSWKVNFPWSVFPMSFAASFLLLILTIFLSKILHNFFTELLITLEVANTLKYLLCNNVLLSAHCFFCQHIVCYCFYYFQFLFKPGLIFRAAPDLCMFPTENL